MNNFAPFDTPPARSPWGAVQHQERIGNGIWTIVTASHGGIWLDRSARGVMRERFGPAPFLGGFAWWEEDCDAVLTVIVLRDRISGWFWDGVRVPDPKYVDDYLRRCSTIKGRDGFRKAIDRLESEVSR